MKILLTTLNSKYVHSNLALKYLYTVMAGEKSQVEVREFTINNDPGYIFTELVRANYDMVCFSCYIWNIEQIKLLACDLKKARPEMKIMVGGPEVSCDGPAEYQNACYGQEYFDKLVETLIYYKSYFSLEGNRLNELCEKYPERKNSYLSSKVLRYKLKNFSPNVHNPEDVRYFD